MTTHSEFVKVEQNAIDEFIDEHTDEVDETISVHKSVRALHAAKVGK